MKLSIYAFILLCLGVVCIEAAPSSSSSSSSKKKKSLTWKCDLKDEASLDAMIARATIVSHPAEKFPENTKELKLICEKDIPALKRMEEYRDVCTSGSTKQVLSVLLYSLRGMIGQYCKKVNSRKAKALIAGGSCFNAAKGRLGKCMSSAIDNLSAAIDEPSKLKRTQMCCAYSDAIKCIGAQLEGVCEEKHIETMIIFFKSILENAFNVVCGDIGDDSDKCDAYPFIGKSKVQKAAAKYKFQSVFLPLLKIMQSL